MMIMKKEQQLKVHDSHFDYFPPLIMFWNSNVSHTDNNGFLNIYPIFLATMFIHSEKMKKEK